MPYYVVIVKERGKDKSFVLPDTAFAPCISEAWDEAVRMAPKGTMVIDVISEESKRV